jgi:hypothetical protein
VTAGRLEAPKVDSLDLSVDFVRNLTRLALLRPPRERARTRLLDMLTVLEKKRFIQVRPLLLVLAIETCSV